MTSWRVDRVSRSENKKVIKLVLPLGLNSKEGI